MQKIYIFLSEDEIKFRKKNKENFPFQKTSSSFSKNFSKRFPLNFTLHRV
jgi:hypothetical protein